MNMRRLLLSLCSVTALTGALAGCGDDPASADADVAAPVASSTTAPPTTVTTTTTTVAVLPATTTAGGCTAVGASAVDSSPGLHVDLAEWTVIPGDRPATAGTTSVEVTNLGAVGHELVIVRGVHAADLSIPENSADLSSLPDGAAVVGEIKDVAAGATCAATFELPVGDYVLLCNIAHADPGHIERGMVTDLTIG